MVKKKSDNEFLDMWVKRVYLMVDDPFPSTSRCQEVTKTTELVINPLESAVSAVAEKTVEIIKMTEAAALLTERKGESSFTMCINGTVDAPVNGKVNLFFVLRTKYPSYLIATNRRI